MPLASLVRSRVGAPRAALVAGTLAGSLAAAPAGAVPGPLTGSFSLFIAPASDQQSLYQTSGPFGGAISKTVTSTAGAAQVTMIASAEGYAGRPALQPQQQNIAIGLKTFASVEAISPQQAGASNVGGSAPASASTTVNVPFVVTNGSGTGTMQLRLKLDGDIAFSAPFVAYSTVGHGRTNGKAEMYFWATGLNATGCPYYTNSACWAVTRQSPTDDVRFNNPNRVWTLNIPFTFGVESSFFMQMWSTADAYAESGWGSASGASSGAMAVTSNYLSTAALDGIVAVLDSNGNALSGWSVTTAPGYDLTARAATNAIPAAAPQAAMLLGLGLLWQAGRRGRAA